MKILISAGPTREAIDPVRFISNRSTGRMGYALAEAALALGHEVSLVSGPVALTPPKGLAEFRPVVSAAEMAEAMKSLAPSAGMIVMCAAVADYRPARVHQAKMKKGEGPLSLELVRTEDILASLGESKRPGQLLVGFAAETEDLVANADGKMRRKNLDWIVANDVSRSDRGFESESNAVTLLSSSGRRIEIPLQAKRELAARILEYLLMA
jgi:phosphopantothenoylcysteine decarboxylase/phosphopantothenate--cysteine ligase